MVLLYIYGNIDPINKNPSHVSIFLPAPWIMGRMFHSKNHPFQGIHQFRDPNPPPQVAEPSWVWFTASWHKTRAGYDDLL